MTTTDTRPARDTVSPPDPRQHLRDRFQTNIGSWTAAAVISLVAFITGGVGLVYEYLLATTATYLLGSSNEQYALTFGVMMGCMGLGGIWQRKLPDHRALPSFIIAEFTLALLGGFAPISNVTAFSLMPDHYDIVQYFFICAIGLLIGIEIPLAARLQSVYLTKISDNLASVTGADYIGALVGSLAWVQLLHHEMPITQMGFLVAMGNVAVAVLTLGFFWFRRLITSRRTKILSLLVGIVSVSALSVGFTAAPGWAAQSEQALYEDPIVTTITTPYQHIVVTDRELAGHVNGTTTERTLWINGNRQFSSIDEAMYHEPLVHPVMSLSPHRRVLILGGGDGLALREVEKWQGVESITLVDLDPDMIRIARTNPIFTSLNHNSFKDARVHTQVSPGVVDAGYKASVYMDTDQTKKVNGVDVDQSKPVAEVNVYTIDAAKFVEALKGQYDTVIIDLVDPSTIDVAKLYSAEFYAKVRALMAPDGMMAVQSGSPFHANRSYNCIVNTVKAAGFSVLPYHTNVPSFGDWGWTLAWNQSLTTEQMHQRVDALPNTWPIDTRFLVDRASFTSMFSFGKGQLDPTVGVSTLTNPRIVNYYVEDGWRVE